jgi:CubicO group peptidase (beta-lactamase class C family)
MMGLAGWPMAGWALDGAGLEAAWDYSREHNGLSLLVIQHGRILMERYAAGDGPDVRHKIYSGTKGLWCVAAVAAQADGLLNLDEPVADTITEWRGRPDRDRITIRELLNFTAGIDPGFHLHSDDVRDRDGYAVALPEVAPPGGSFIYGPGQIQIFCEVLRRKLARRGGETPWHYLTRRVLRPIGIGPVPHKVDAMGNPLCAAGVQMSAREWARWGEFLLGGGRRVLPPGALGECLCGTRRNPAFGMGFWLNEEGSSGRAVNVEDALEPKWWQVNWSDVCICPEAPRDLFVSLGSEGQRLYVIPSMDMVVVRLSEDSHYSDAEFLRLLLR